jgi:sentrin-specific protease 1
MLFMNKKRLECKIADIEKELSSPVQKIKGRIRSEEIDKAHKSMQELRSSAIKKKKEYNDMVQARLVELSKDPANSLHLKECKPKISLSQSEIERVSKEMSTGKDDDILAEKFDICITRADFKLLSDGEWLNDEVVNFYIQMLLERNQLRQHRKVYIFNTHFYPLVQPKGKYDYNRVRRWTLKQKIDVFSLDKVLVPIHLGNHWCLAVINFIDKRFEYYDSLGAANPHCLKILRQWLQDESVNKRGKQFDLTAWVDYTPKDIPLQRNGFDCGVFMCKFADYTSRNQTFTFAQQDMKYFRQLIALELLNKSVLE